MYICSRVMNKKPFLHTILSPGLLNLYEVKDSIVVIIDVFRATSTIATALYNGATKIIPVSQVEDCIAIGKELNAITAGERDGKIIEGLQHGNSPAEYPASFIKGKHKASDVEVWVVPGSKQVEKQAIEEGIHKIFEDAGFTLRQPGCSACLGMNEDKIPAGKYCISTSNRNFEGRQGPNARTFLASPLTAAAAAITGEVTDVRELLS